MRRIVLLSNTPISKGFTEAQSQLYNFLLERVQAKNPPSILEMIEAMECQSPAPIFSRLEHLQEKGALQIQTV